MPFIQRLGLRGLLSFPPDMEPIELRPLNVLIGPNGSGKSNVIHALELLRAATLDIAETLQDGGGTREWLWKGPHDSFESAIIDVMTGSPFHFPSVHHVNYNLMITEFMNITRIDERIEDVVETLEGAKIRFHYETASNAPVIKRRDATSGDRLVRTYMKAPIPDGNQSVFTTFRNPQAPVEIRSAGESFNRIATFQEWVFGARSSLRKPAQLEDTPNKLLPDSSNLALVLNEINHRDSMAFDAAMKRFLPRYEHTSTRIVGDTAQLYLHEKGLKNPIPSTRISDGTFRFLGMMAALFAPHPPTLLCVEEPELGLHPDAVALLAELLIEASNRMQIVVTTHSESFLSELGERVDSVLVCENHGYGTTVDRLDAKRLAYWLEKYTLGDIWKIGELGGNP